MTRAQIPELRAELAELVALPGLAGAEGAVATWITGRLERAGLVPTVDTLGNVILVSPSLPPRLLVTAHMDQVGYMISRIEADHARCLPVGAPEIGGNRHEPVQVAGERPEGPFEGTVRVHEEGGAVLRTDALRSLRIGDCVLFAGSPVPHAGTRIVSPALDDRVGCLAVLQAALTAHPTEGVAFAWTVREETEMAGIMRVARDLKPAAVVTVDVTPATAADEAFDSIVRCGSGPVITLLDEGMVVDRELLDGFTTAAAALNISWQPEVVAEGLSEAGQVQQSLGISALALLVAIENSHSPAEAADLRDLADAIALLAAVLKRG